MTGPDHAQPLPTSCECPGLSPSCPRNAATTLEMKRSAGDGLAHVSWSRTKSRMLGAASHASAGAEPSLGSWRACAAARRRCLAHATASMEDTYSGPAAARFRRCCRSSRTASPKARYGSAGACARACATGPGLAGLQHRRSRQFAQARLSNAAQPWCCSAHRQHDSVRCPWRFAP